MPDPFVSGLFVKATPEPEDVPDDNCGVIPLQVVFTAEAVVTDGPTENKETDR